MQFYSCGHPRRYQGSIMVTEIDYPAWIMLALGIYAAAAGIGEWRRPGLWIFTEAN